MNLKFTLKAIGISVQTMLCPLTIDSLGFLIHRSILLKLINPQYNALRFHSKITLPSAKFNNEVYNQKKEKREKTFQFHHFA